ncbi:hypothetical protein [Streptomyces sp. NPDC096153]|uniref:hypothetical protein n=1 Tax=Streptomyces sp. NPDC096153 TaxID=3155548 RepID=UPI00331BCB4C
MSEAEAAQLMLRAVRRADDFYTPPPGEPVDAWDLVPPAERVIRFMENLTQRTWPRPGPDVVGQVIARIDAGRWVAQCPTCSSAQVVAPADPRMWCVDCQPDTWLGVRFPENPEAAEATVADRPVSERFWWADDDSEAWNKPPASPPPEPTEKMRRVLEQQDSRPPEPPAEEPAEEGGA